MLRATKESWPEFLAPLSPQPCTTVHSRARGATSGGEHSPEPSCDGDSLVTREEKVKDRRTFEVIGAHCSGLYVVDTISSSVRGEYKDGVRCYRKQSGGTCWTMTRASGFWYIDTDHCGEGGGIWDRAQNNKPLYRNRMRGSNVPPSSGWEVAPNASAGTTRPPTVMDSQEETDDHKGSQNVADICRYTS